MIPPLGSGAHAAISYLGEERSPDWLDIDDTGGLDDSVDLVGLVAHTNVSYRPDFSTFDCSLWGIGGNISELRCAMQYFPHPPPPPRDQTQVVAYRDLDTIIGEDERRVGRCQLCSRHGDCVGYRDADVLRLERNWFVVGCQDREVDIRQRREN